MYGWECLIEQKPTLYNVWLTLYNVYLVFLEGFFFVISLLSMYLQVTLVAEERDSNINQVQELESQVAELKNAAGK